MLCFSMLKTVTDPSLAAVASMWLWQLASTLSRAMFMPCPALPSILAQSQILRLPSVLVLASKVMSGMLASLVTPALCSAK